MTDPLIELAARCEAATAGSRELDCLIFESQHLLLKPNHRGTIDGEPTGEYFDQDGNQLPERAPRFTESIDVAMTLVPEGYYWHVGHGRTRDDEPLGAASIIAPGSLKTVEAAEAPTAALALCAASLRARAHLQRHRE